MAELKIDTQQVVTCSTALRIDARKVDLQIGEIDKLLKNIKKFYSTENTEMLQKKYNEMSKQARNLSTAINNYCSFIEKAADCFEEVEKKLEKQLIEMDSRIVKTATDEWK